MSTTKHKKVLGAKTKTGLQWQSDDCASDPLYFLHIQDVWKEITKEAKIDDIKHLKLKKDVRIAVLDTGIYENHAAFKESETPQPSQTESSSSGGDGDARGSQQMQVALKSRIVDRKNFVPDTIEIDKEEIETKADSDLTEDEYGHGTFCAALCAGGTFQPVIQDDAAILTHSLQTAPFASAKKCTQILFETDFHCGVAPFAKLLNGKVASDELCKSKWIAKGIEWARENEADIISVSIGQNHFDKQLQRAVDEALKDGAIIVCAASNDGRKERNSIQYPAKLGNVLCVGSHDSNGVHSKFSSRGREVDILGPGEDVWSAASGGHEAAVVEKSGTSFSAPYIAGLCALVLAYAEVAGGPTLRERVSNIVVMRQLLREMASSPNHHDETEGYGCLNPMSIFRYGKDYFNKLVGDIVHEPDELRTTSRNQMMFAYLNKFDVLDFFKKRHLGYGTQNVLQEFLTEQAGSNALQQRCDTIQREHTQATSSTSVEEDSHEEDFCLTFDPQWSEVPNTQLELLKNIIVLYLQDKLMGRGKIKTLKIGALMKEHLHLVENICDTFGVEELVLARAEEVYALFKCQSQSSQKNEPSKEETSEDTFVSLPQDKFSVHLQCPPAKLEEIRSAFGFKDIKEIQYPLPCDSEKVTQISLKDIDTFLTNCFMVADSYSCGIRALNFLKLYKYPFWRNLQSLSLDPYVDIPVGGTSEVWLFQPVALEEEMFNVFQKIHEVCSGFHPDGQYHVERVVMPRISHVRDPMPLLSSPLVQNSKQLIFYEVLTLTDVVCLAGRLQNQLEKAVFKRISFSFEQTLPWGHDSSHRGAVIEKPRKAIPYAVEWVETDRHHIHVNSQLHLKQVLTTLDKILGNRGFTRISWKICSWLPEAAKNCHSCKVVADVLLPHLEEHKTSVSEIHVVNNEHKTVPSERNCLGKNCPCSCAPAFQYTRDVILTQQRTEEHLKTKITIAIFGDGIRPYPEQMFIPESGTEISDGYLSRQQDGHFFANFVETEDCLTFEEGFVTMSSEQICLVPELDLEKGLDLTPARLRILSLKVADKKSHIDPRWLYEALDFLENKEKQAQFHAGKKSHEWPQADVLVFPFGLKHSSTEIMKKLISLMQRGKVVVAAAWRTPRGISFPGCLGDVITMGFSSSGFQHEGREVDFLADNLIQVYSKKKAEKFPGYQAGPPTVGEMLGYVTSLTSNIIHHAEEIGGREYRRAVTNNAVMREILHRMCSDPGHHTQDKGYGQLDPQLIYHKGREYFKMMLEEIVPSLTEERVFQQH